MAVPGLPIPATIGRTSLTHRRRTSRSVLSLLESPNLRRRAAYALLLFLVFLFGRRTGTSSVSPKPPPFYVSPAALPGPPSPPTGFSATPERKIPPIVHYVFGMKEDFGGKPFGFIQFVAINSMLENIKPEKVMFHHIYEPSGWWWNKIKEYADKKGVKWEMTKAREVDEILCVTTGFSLALAMYRA